MSNATRVALTEIMLAAQGIHQNRQNGWLEAPEVARLLSSTIDTLLRDGEAERLTPQEMVELMALVIMAGPNVPRSIDPIMRKMGDIIRRSEIKP